MLTPRQIPSVFDEEFISQSSFSHVYNAECYQDSEYKNLEIYYGA